MATVTCTQQCYFYINDAYKGSSTYTESGLTSGAAYTPSHPNHMPYYDSSLYTSYRITYNGADCTSGAITCPSSNFTIVYNFYAYLIEPTWVITEYGKDYVSVSVTNIGSFSYFSFSVENMNGVTVATSGYSSSTTRKLSGLSANTAYYVVCSWSTSTSSMGFYNTLTFTTNKSVSKWDWNIANGDEATASQTKAAYNAVTGKGKVSDFSYLVWNDLVDKVYEVKQAAGKNWDNTYATYSATKMSYSNKTLTATRFNSIRHNIGIHVSTGISEVKTGDTVYGSYFITLANCLNTWINSV